MKQSVLDLQARVQALLGDRIVSSDTVFGELTLEVSALEAFSALELIKNELQFAQLIDLCGVDYLAYGDATWETRKATSHGFSRGVFDFEETDESAELEQPRRFAVVYHLLSIENNLRLRVKVYPEDTRMPIVDSVVSLWACADWYEREAFDLFGIVFQGHPDLRRILTDYGFVGHPLRKDFPLIGQVEMRYDADQSRVIYQPVSIENRVNVPRVIRSDAEPNG